MIGIDRAPEAAHREPPLDTGTIRFSTIAGGHGIMTGYRNKRAPDHAAFSAIHVIGAGTSSTEEPG